MRAAAWTLGVQMCMCPRGTLWRGQVVALSMSPRTATAGEQGADGSLDAAEAAGASEGGSLPWPPACRAVLIRQEERGQEGEAPSTHPHLSCFSLLPRSRKGLMCLMHWISWRTKPSWRSSVGIGDGNLQYYLYNWKCPSMGAEKVCTFWASNPTMLPGSRAHGGAGLGQA